MTDPAANVLEPMTRVLAEALHSQCWAHPGRHTSEEHLPMAEHLLPVVQARISAVLRLLADSHERRARSVVGGAGARHIIAAHKDAAAQARKLADDPAVLAR